MWQIITHNLSIIHTQGLFVVTQIAAANLVTGKMTFAKVRVTSSCNARSCFYSNEPVTPAPLCVTKKRKKTLELSLTGFRPRFTQKGNRSAITMSRFHFFRSRVSTLVCMQTNTADDCIHNYKSAYCSAPFWVFILAKCLLQDSPPAHCWKQKGSFFGVKTYRMLWKSCHKWSANVITE